MESNSLASGRSAALLAIPKLLEDLYNYFDKFDTGYMEIVQLLLESRADVELEEQHNQPMPIYKRPAWYAKKHEEMDCYYASHSINIACKEAIESAIAEHYPNKLVTTESVQQVIEQFNYERVFYVLAATIQEKEGDPNISAKNKEWAKKFHITEDMDGEKRNRNHDFFVKSYDSGLIDIFIKIARKEFLLTQPLTKEEIIQEADRILKSLQEKKEPNSPDGKKFMTHLSMDFLIRAGTEDFDRLISLLPFKSLTLAAVKDWEGVYAFISQESRNQELQFI